MRGKLKKKHPHTPDINYNSPKVGRFINYVMLDGKKTTAQKIVYGSFEVIKEKTENPNPLEIFDLAIKNSSPLMEVRSRRIGGANYQVPREVRPERRLQMSMRWILAAARAGKGRPIHERLADELIAASKGEGNAVKKKENTHKMADANKAFAHFSW
ncbi:MAG: small subunit ribosomal protein S7 [Planctomycetota bacterium]|jgi:small subunit ribosomal protein S7